MITVIIVAVLVYLLIGVCTIISTLVVRLLDESRLEEILKMSLWEQGIAWPKAFYRAAKVLKGARY